MSAEPLRLLDPEVIAPSRDSMYDLRFWRRMMDWGTENALRIGPASMEALQGMAASPPQINGLPAGDFWSIISRFMSRGLPPRTADRELCVEHLENDYKPLMGDADNVLRLVADLRATGPVGRVALSTSDACWATAERECAACVSSRVHRLSGPNGESGQLPRVRQAAFLDEHNGDLRKLGAYASEMFPNLRFSTVALDHLDTLAGSSHDALAAIVNHLRVLDQEAPRVWREQVTTQLRQAALASHGITASPESPQTHKNKSAMAARDFVFDDGTHRCEWHSKLRPEVNRIYFAIDGDVVRIGTIVDHLST